LIGPDETIFKFYSQWKKKKAGNFYTNKRIAAYWFDDYHEERTYVSYAFYGDIKSIDTAYYRGLTYAPDMLITKFDGTQFRCYVEGSHEQLRAFFDGAMSQWVQSKKISK
jgi:hypothetical protein